MRGDVFLGFLFICLHSGVEDGLKVGIGSGRGWSLGHSDRVRVLFSDGGDERADVPLPLVFDTVGRRPKGVVWLCRRLDLQGSHD